MSEAADTIYRIVIDGDVNKLVINSDKVMLGTKFEYRGKRYRINRMRTQDFKMYYYAKEY